MRVDLLLHALVSAAFPVVGGHLFGGAGLYGGLVLGLVAGLGKEAWDKASGRGTPEWADVAADVVGLALGGGLTLHCLFSRGAVSL